MPRRNRKRIIKEGWIDYKEEQIEICNSLDYGIYEEIIVSLIEQLDTSIDIHKRVLCVRLDFHINYHTGTNLRFSNFLKQMKQRILRDYGIKQIGHQWVREQEKSKKQHYHLVLFLDGNKIQNPKKLNESIREMWLPRGTMYIPENCYTYIDKHNMSTTRPKIIYRSSYMAKIRGKSYRDSQTKDYSSSRLRH